ncbi:hypothetical protein ACFSTE_17305 [Aquimarina hainanensis]|uniref:DUF4893 domain-containing protein n=2 Tax=Aquimarina hainanensis TaxID=1578017 RepID=A0ABW5NAF6_9FLAO
MKTQKFIYAIMAVTLFFVTSCSKDSIVDHNSEVNEANSETAFLENLESESSSKSGIVFPDSHQDSLDSNQEFIDFLEGDWKVIRTTDEDSQDRINAILHLRNQSGDNIINGELEECNGQEGNPMFFAFKTRSLKKIASGVRGVFDGVENSFFENSVFLGCGLRSSPIGKVLGYSHDRFGVYTKEKNKEVAISIKNSLLVIGDFSKNEVIVFKKM